MKRKKDKETAFKLHYYSNNKRLQKNRALLVVQQKNLISPAFIFG